MGMLRITDDLDAMLDVLPPQVREPLLERPENFELLEVVLDLGRLPEARYPEREVVLSEREVAEADLDYIVSRIGEFTSDNRAGIERTLHRISAIRNRRGRIVGLTCRVGRAVFGTIRIIEDLVRSGKSILLLGRPGVGKTTMLREVARFLADDMNKRVVVVDTSNEIAGDGDIPHPGIGSARRMQVPTPTMQHAVMIEAVENHMPEVIIIDEIGTDLEAAAARTIAERGVQLVATAHGNTLENLIMNPTLCDLIGGIQSVTLGDEEARRRGTQKSILERKAPPTFDVVVEIQSWERVSVHPNVAETVDSILRGYNVPAEVREIDKEGEVRVTASPLPSGREKRSPERRGPVAAGRERKIYPFGVSRRRLEQAIHQMGMPATIVEQLVDADALVTLRSYYRRKPQVLRDAEERGVPIYVIKSNTVFQMEQCILSMRSERGQDPVLSALQEAEEAIGEVMKAERPIELSPQNAYIRRLQHMLAQRYNLTSRSMGQEPQRRVRILPGGAA
ncbi:MAG: R3H domain-containing nucleic acid-binding protein [Chloroflexota bacterium]|nr:R3H domain-containing nucleic acid-binding protein [Chloroflexota bacterium]